jgi:spore coat protein U-like protein
MFWSTPMKKTRHLWLQLGLVIFFSVIGSRAHAAITCNLTSSGISSSYRPANTSNTVTAGFFTMTCTRGLASDPTSLAYTVTVNNGQKPVSFFNTASWAGNLMGYATYTNSSCATQWTGPVTLGATITFSSSNDFAPKSDIRQFWACISTANGNPAPGTYTDTVTMTPSVGTPKTFPVSIVTPSTCSISTPPGNLLFTYAAFQGAAASASTTFSAICNNTVPYTMALDSTSGILLGLNYSLNISAPSAVGTGGAQNFTISGSIAAGQAGACATGTCNSSAPRTLTVTY